VENGRWMRKGKMVGTECKKGEMVSKRKGGLENGNGKGGRDIIPCIDHLLPGFLIISHRIIINQNWIQQFQLFSFIKKIYSTFDNS
jgi:hypothetical protein